MTKRPTLRFFLNTALGGISFLGSLMSIAMPNWIERIFYVEPDAGLVLGSSQTCGARLVACRQTIWLTWLGWLNAFANRRTYQHGI